MDTLFIAVLITVKDLTEKIKKVTRGLQMSANVFITLLLDMLPIKCNKHILQIIQRMHVIICQILQFKGKKFTPAI